MEQMFLWKDLEGWETLREKITLLDMKKKHSKETLYIIFGIISQFLSLNQVTYQWLDYISYIYFYIQVYS